MPLAYRWQRVIVPDIPDLRAWNYGDETTANTAITTHEEWRLFVNNGTTNAAATGAYYRTTTETTTVTANYLNQTTNWTADTGNWVYQPRVLSPEQQARQAAAAKRANRRREIAVIRARKLLAEHLDSGELDQLEEKGYFEVKSSSGRVYRVYRGHSRNVVELDAEGREVNRLCAYSRTGAAMPDEDHMLVQKLMLQTDEEAYRKVANHSRIYIPGTVAAARATEQRYRDILAVAA